MPFVLKHGLTSRIYTCRLVNHYNLEYYGTKYWESEEEARTGRESFLTERNEAEPDNWEIWEIDEKELKLFNVRLKNDPSNQLFLDDAGRPAVRKKKARLNLIARITVLLEVL